MANASTTVLRRMDWLMIAISLLLALYGLMMLYGLEVTAGGPLSFFNKQLLFFISGIGLFGFVAVTRFQHLVSYAWWQYGLGLALLAAVIFFGQEIRGVKGWFILGPLSFQPVEFVKVLVILFFAKFFSENTQNLTHMRYSIVSIALILPYIGLLMLQPDLGSAFIVGMIWLVMLLFTKIKTKQIMAIVLAIIVTAAASWFVLADYQKARLTTFMNPELDPQGAGYNIRQAITAVGSGQLLGRGLGLGPQSQLRFLPENKTDFIFSVIAEELGFVGAAILLVLFAILFYRLLRIVNVSQSLFGQFIVIGVIVFIGTQSFMNIAMNLSLFPVTGVPLPLVSQGGSSLWSIFIALGLTQSVLIYSSATRNQ